MKLEPFFAFSRVTVAAALMTAACTGGSDLQYPLLPDGGSTSQDDDGIPDWTGSDGGKSSSSSSSGSSGGSSSGGSSSGGSSSSSSGGSSSGTPSVSEQCTPVAVSCPAGGTMSYCITYAGSTCQSIVYKYGSKTFPCGSGCTGECTDSYYEAYTECQDAVGACNELAACCSAMSDVYRPSCISTYDSYVGKAYGDVSCKSAVQSYRSSSLCP